MKTDITNLGKDPKTGLKMHAFRYKGDPKTYPKVVGPMAQDVEKKFPGSTTPMGEDGKLAIRGYAGGTPFVQPPLTPFIPKSSPGVATGIGALSAFRPPVKLPRGATIPKMQKFADGTDFVAPNMDDVELGSQIMGEPSMSGDGIADKLRKLASDVGGGGSAKPAAAPEQQQQPKGWNAPSMGYALQGFARGAAQVPGQGAGDVVPSLLTPGEAVLTPGAAQHVGRSNVAMLNAMHPPANRGTTMLRAGARGMIGALANTKTRPRVAGGLSG